MTLHATSSVGAATAAAPTTPSTGNAATVAGDPQLLRWDGEPQGWWSRNGANVGIGAFSGGMAAMVTGFATVDAARLVGSSRALAIGGAALGVGLLASGIAAMVRRGDDRLPDPPSGPIPSLDAPVAPAPVHGGERPRGSHLGHGSGSYTEQVPVTRTRVGSDGQLETYTEYETQWRYFSWDVQLQEQVGRRDGWPSVDAALSELNRGDAVALRHQDGRVVAYDLTNRSHWGDLDRLRIDDPATEAVVTPGGSVWERTHGGDFDRAGRIERLDPTRAVGHTVGEHELRHRGNPEVRVELLRTASAGLATEGEAVGLARHLPGDQVVLRGSGRYHVADVSSPQLDRSHPNDGLVTAGRADDVVMLEQQGARWAPLDGWYVRPNERAE